MKLSAAIIERELSRQYHMTESHSPDTELVLKRPLFFRAGDISDPYRIYLCDADSVISEVPAYCLMIFFCPVTDDKPACNYIFLNPDTSSDAVMNSLQLIFENYTDWEYRISRAVTEESIQNILDISVPFFSNMLVLTDVNFRLITYSVFHPETHEGGQFGVAPTNTSERYLKLKHYYEQHIADTDCFVIPEDILGYKKLACNLFLSGNNIGAVTVHPSLQPFSRQDAALLLFLCRSIESSMSFLVGSMRPEGHIERVLQKMIAHERVSNEELELAVSYSGFKENDLFTCIVFPVPSPKEREHVLFLRRRLSAGIQPCAFFEKKNTVYVLLLNPGGEHMREARKRQEQEISQMLDILGMYGGVSDPFTDLDMFPYYCQEALLAIRYGRERSGVRLFFFSDCKSDYMLDSSVGSLKKEMMYSEGFRRLLSSSHKLDYIHTLEVYLDENMNALQAAKKLFIHRNTLMARIENIRVILNVNLEDAESRFLVNYYLRLYRSDAAQNGTSEMPGSTK